MPVRARRVAPGAVDLDAALAEIGEPLGHLAQRSDLPGDLVGGDLGMFGVGAAPPIDRAPRKDHEGMVVGAVAQEIAGGRPDLALELGRQPRPHVVRVGHPEPEQPAVEIERLVRLDDIDAEMAEPADAERPRQPHAADRVARAARFTLDFIGPGHPRSGQYPLESNPGSIQRINALLQSVDGFIWSIGIAARFQLTRCCSRART